MVYYLNPARNVCYRIEEVNRTSTRRTCKNTTSFKQDQIDNEHIEVVLHALPEFCDPFSAPASTSACLLNIATGKGASASTQKYLTESFLPGHDLHKKFREECTDDSSRLLKPITRRKVCNFASENTKPKQSAVLKSTSAASSRRDSFIRMIVVISQNTKFSLQHVLNHQITEVPLSIAQPDGSLVKTEKSKLLKKLEST